MLDNSGCLCVWIVSLLFGRRHSCLRRVTALLSYVDLRGLCKVKLFVSGLLHKVEKRVFKHVLKHPHKVVFQEHALSEELRVSSSSISHAADELELLFEALGVLVPELCRWLLVNAAGLSGQDRFEVRGLFVCDVSAKEAVRAVFAIVECLLQILTLHNLVHGLDQEVVNQGIGGNS